MTERSSSQGRGGPGGQGDPGGQGAQGIRPGDWGGGSHAAREQHYGAGTADAYGAVAPTGSYGTVARTTGAHAAGAAGTLGAGTAGAFGAGTTAAHGAGTAGAYGSGTAGGAYGAGAAGAYGTGATGAYGTGATGAYGTGATGTFGTGATGAFGTGATGAYGAGVADPFGQGTTGSYRQGPADAFGSGSADAFGAGTAGAYGAGPADAGMGRPDAEPFTAAIRQPSTRGAADAKGFLSALFDFGFTSFVTPKVIKMLYVLIMIGTVLSALAFTITAFEANAIFGFLMLVFGVPLFILIVMAIYRIILEFFVVIFRVAEDIQALRERGDIG